jgi:hypothetical protein
MKRLKALFGFLAISLSLATMPLGATATITNVPVVHGAWTFIGVPGFQAFGASSGSSGTLFSGTTRIVDAAGTLLDGTDYQVAGLEVPTWDGNVTDPVTTTTASAINDTTNSNDPRVPVPDAALGSSIYGTVAIMALGQDTTDATSSTTDHSGAVIAALEWTAVPKVHESPIRTMYIQSPDASYPDIKIMYQANQEGAKFQVQYELTGATALTETDNTTYEGTFNRAYTYTNAAVLGTDFLALSASSTSGVSGNDVAGILASFDMDITDNELNSSKNLIEPNTAYETFNGTAYATSDRGTLDGNMTVLWWDSPTQQWRVYKATGNGTTVTVDAASNPNSAGTMGQFEKGRGYWVKVDPDSASTAVTSGFVLGYDDAATIDHTNYIADGWNMLSFGDEYFSYSVTGMILGTADSDLNITDTYGANQLDIPAATATFFSNPAAACTAINQAIDGNNTLAFTDFQLRCVPDIANTQVALLSTRRFTVGFDSAAGSSVLGLDGEDLTLLAEDDGVSTNTDWIRTQYGSYAVVIEPNTDFATYTGYDGNISIEFPANDYGAAYGTIGTTVPAAATGALAALTAGSTGGTGLTSPLNAVTELDMNFDGANDSLLLGSNYRFFVKDATIVRTFTYDKTAADANITEGATNEENNVSVYIVGMNDHNITVVDDNLVTTASYINTASAFAATGVGAAVLNDTNTTLMIFYTGLNETAGTRAAKVDLQEWGESWDLFTETYASSESNTTARGAIKSAWQISGIASAIQDTNASNQYDGNYTGEFTEVTTDLKYSALYAENFPVDGPLYDIKTTYAKTAELIITGQTEAVTGTFISWKQIDVSKPTDEWYDTDDQFELFWTEKEKGYWVYLNGDAENDLNINAPVISAGTYAHFNNKFSGSSTTGTTRNHLNKTLTVQIDNLTDLGATSNTDAFEVYASIAGNMTSFQRTGATNSFTIPLDSHETTGLSFDAGEVTITITAAEGSGKKVSTTYTLDYEKPVISSMVLTGTDLAVAVTNDDASTLHVYSGDINDSSYGSSSATNWAGSVTYAAGTPVDLASMTGLGFPTSFENNSTAYQLTSWFDTTAEQIDEGLIRDVRVVALDASGLYSDQERFYYVPVYAGTGVLASSLTPATIGSTTDTAYDSYPQVYETTGEDNASYDGTNDNGVQLAGNGSLVTCAYPALDSKLDQGVPISKTLETTSGTVIGYIMYSPDYIGKPLVCQDSVTGAAYVGGFSALAETSDGDTSIITMQPFSSSVSVSLSK